jgi:2'-5' RNA ligase
MDTPAPLSSARVFWAIPFEPSPQITQVFADLARWRSSLKIVRPEQLHLTLKFLGDTPTEQIDAIAAAGLSTVRETVPAIACRGLGVFPPRGRPNVLWAGLERVDELFRLAADIDAAMTALGFAPERRAFNPHLTLARFRSPPPRPMQRWLDEHREVAFGMLPVRKLVLYRSQLTPAGSIYAPVAKAPLT